MNTHDVPSAFVVYLASRWRSERTHKRTGIKHQISIGSMAATIALLVSMVGQAAADDHGKCDLNVKLTSAAEMKRGGANFKGEGSAMPAMKMTVDKDMKMSGDEGMQMAGSNGMKMSGDMPGAHEVHESQYGATFFMAPNQTHHIEGKYTDECGFSLVLFNAFTEPINTSRFKAFIKFIPDDLDEPEAYRILTPNTNGSVLRGPTGPEIKGEFDIELYVLFPGEDEPTMFNIPGIKRVHDDAK